jgi:hypothetical protein
MPLRFVLKSLRKLLVASLSGILITAIALVVFWLVAGDWVAERMAGFANRKFFTDRNTRLVVDRVTGSVFSDMVLEGVRLEREVGGAWQSSITAERIEARYALSALLGGRPSFSLVRVYRPLIEVSEDSTGRIVLPIGRGTGAGAGGGAREFQFSDIEVVGGLFRYSGRTRGFEASDLDMRARLVVRGPEIELDLERASFIMLDPVGRVENVSGSLRVAGRRIEGTDLDLKWEGSELAGGFLLNPADSTAGFRVDARMADIPLGRVRGLIESPLIPETGWMTGRMALLGTTSRFEYDAALTGYYGPHPVDTLRVAGRRDGSLIEVDRLRLAMPQYDIAEAAGTFDVAGGGRLDVNALLNAVQLDSVPIEAVNWIPGVARGRLGLELEGFLKREERLVVDVGFDFTGESLFGVDVAGARGRLQFAEGSDVILEDLRLTLPDGGFLDARGFVHPGEVLDFDLVAETGDWSQLTPIIAVPELAGSGRARGRIEGTVARPVIRAAGSFRNVVAWGIPADSLELVNLEGPFLPEPEFTGTIAAKSLTGIGRIFDTVDMDFAWAAPRLTFSNLVAVAKDTTAEGGGVADFHPEAEAVDIEVPEGRLTMGRLTWTPAGPLRVEGRGESWRIARNRWTSTAGGADIEAVFDNGRGTMLVDAATMDIDLAELVGPDAPPEFGGGRLTGDLRLSGATSNPDPSGRLALSDYRWRGARLDSAYVDFDARGTRVDIRDGVARAGEAPLRFAGALELPHSAWITWSRWLNEKPVAWENVTLSGLEVSGAGVELAPWAAFNPDLDPLVGRVTGDAALDGRLGRPRISVGLLFEELAQGRWAVDSLRVAGLLENDRARFDDIVVARNGNSARITGAVPVRLSLAPFEMEPVEESVDLTVDLSRADLNLIPPAQFGFDEASGDIEGTLHFTGTPRAPEATGELTLSGGRVRMKDREEVVEDIRARLVFEGREGRLVELTGRQAPTGQVTGSGTFPVGGENPGATVLTFQLRNFVARQSGEYAARFDGDFQVRIVPGPDGSLRPSTVGDVRLDRAEIIREFNQTAPPPPEQVYEYDITIDAPRGIIIANSQLDLELAGDLHARQTADRFELIGELEILRGWYTLLLRRFKVIEGTLTFNRVDIIDPDIDITAETNDAEYIITVRITGQASNPRLQFSARKPNEDDAAPLSEQQILNRLAPGSALAQGLAGSEDGSTTQAGLEVLASSVQLLFGQVQRDIARSLGVDEVRYESPEATVPGEERSYGRLSVLKSLTPDVTVSYSQELGAPDQGLSVEYRLGRLLFLRGEVVRRRATELREEYNIDLRLWHEY